jgi:hypothetical protein
MLADLGGVVPAGFAVPVMEKATELFNVELSGEAVDHAIRYVRERSSRKVPRKRAVQSWMAKPSRL